MLLERPVHDFFVMLHEKDGHVVNQILDGVPTNAAQEVAEILAVFFVFAVNIHVGAAKVREHATHVGKRKNTQFNCVFNIEDGIANIVGSFHQVHQRMAHPLALGDFRQAERIRRFAVKVRLGREQARGSPVHGETRVLDH